MGYLISEDRIREKAKELNVEYLDRFPKKGYTYIHIHCLTHPDKPIREVELYNFLNRDSTCGCMLQKYTLEDLKNNPNIRGDLEIIGEYKNNSTPIKCKCKICGYEWFVTPNKLTQGRGCPSCYSVKLSAGERYIKKVLLEKGIVFEQQKKFDECRNDKTNRLLKFDFYLPEYNTCIEFQGQQHYKPVLFRYGNKETLEKRKEEAEKIFLENQKKDNIKKEFCKNNKIFLLEISYLNMKNIPNIIDKFLKDISKNP